jgi:spectinomycin phosphotransferase
LVSRTKSAKGGHKHVAEQQDHGHDPEFVRTPPEELDQGDLLDALRDGWGVYPVTATYVPVGGGSYHWRVDDGYGVRHWMTVDDLDNKTFLGDSRNAVYDRLCVAFDNARRLGDDGLEFVIAPVPTRGGQSLWRVGGRHALTLFRFVDTQAGFFGQRRTPSERAMVVEALARLHRARPGTARVARPEVPQRAYLERALSELDRPWSGGPYAERMRVRLLAYAPLVEELLARFDRLSHEVSTTRAPLVLTHGEPHPGNVVFFDGRIQLIDWDTLAVALPERDLWMLDTPDERERYAAASGRQVDGAAIDLYQLRWKLDDIASCVHLMRSVHTENADTAQAWTWAEESFDANQVRPYADPSRPDSPPDRLAFEC